MHNLPSPSTHAESVSWLIERVAFFNEESGFTVLKVKAKGHREQVKVVAPCLRPAPVNG